MKSMWGGAAVAALLAVGGCNAAHGPDQTASAAGNKPTIALVLNIRSDFWKPAEAGVRQAQQELPDFHLVVRYPSQSTPASQLQLLDELRAEHVAGIMVSAIDPAGESDELAQIGKQAALITTDSDVPNSNRIAFVGSSSVQSGALAGKIALKALPDGGKCMGFVGRAGALNAQQRIAGINQAIAGSKVTLGDVESDNLSEVRARQNVGAALADHPDINCMIGFYWYDGPSIRQEVSADGKSGKIAIVAFDDDPRTLDGVAQGEIAGTVVQQPYDWAYQGMQDLARAIKGDESWVPADGMVYLPALIVDQGNIHAYEAQRAKYLEQ